MLNHVPEYPKMDCSKLLGSIRLRLDLANCKFLQFTDPYKIFNNYVLKINEDLQITTSLLYNLYRVPDVFNELLKQDIELLEDRGAFIVVKFRGKAERFSTYYIHCLTNEYVNARVAVIEDSLREFKNM